MFISCLAPITADASSQPNIHVTLVALDGALGSDQSRFVVWRHTRQNSNITHHDAQCAIPAPTTNKAQISARIPLPTPALLTSSDNPLRVYSIALRPLRLSFTTSGASRPCAQTRTGAAAHPPSAPSIAAQPRLRTRLHRQMHTKVVEGRKSSPVAVAYPPPLQRPRCAARTAGSDPRAVHISYRLRKRQRALTTLSRHTP